EPIRFVDILTTASAVANYLGQPTIRAHHLLEAIAILRDEKTMEDLGRPVSPFLRGALGPQGDAEPPVRELAQRWFAQLGSDIDAHIGGSDLDTFIAEVRALADAE